MTHSSGKNNKISLKKNLAVKSPWKYTLLLNFSVKFFPCGVWEKQQTLFTLSLILARGQFLPLESPRRGAAEIWALPTFKSTRLPIQWHNRKIKNRCVCVHCVVLVSDPKNNTINVCGQLFLMAVVAKSFI